MYINIEYFTVDVFSNYEIDYLTTRLTGGSLDLGRGYTASLRMWCSYSVTLTIRLALLWTHNVIWQGWAHVGLGTLFADNFWRGKYAIYLSGAHLFWVGRESGESSLGTLVSKMTYDHGATGKVFMFFVNHPAYFDWRGSISSRVSLLSGENLHDDGNGLFDNKLPVQENDVMSLFSEGTCDYTIILSLIRKRGLCTSTLAL